MFLRRPLPASTPFAFLELVVMEDRNSCLTLRNVWHLGVGVEGGTCCPLSPILSFPPWGNLSDDIPEELCLCLNTAGRRDGEFTLELCGV